MLGYRSLYWRMVLLAWFSLVGSAAFVLALPVFVEFAIDRGLDINEDGVAVGSRGLLVFFGLLVIGSAALRGGFAFGQTYLAEWISQRVAYDIRHAIYNHLQRLSFAYHDKAQPGQIMSRATQAV